VDKQELELIKRLTERLEHLSADSAYAHRASGLRGSLLRSIDRLEAGENVSGEDQARLNELVGYGFKILELAAKEIGKSG
jgi:hypothetical protein